MSDALIESGMPANPDAERAVLGAILLDGGAFDVCASTLHPEDFSVDANRRIYSRMIALRNGTPPRPIDFVALGEELQRTKEVEAIGGPSYLGTLTDGLPRAVNALHYANIVKDKSLRRRAIHAAHAIVQEGLEGSCADDVEDSSAFLERSIDSLSKLADHEPSGCVESMAEVFAREFGQPGEIFTPRESRRGIPTGFWRIDAVTGGLFRGELVVVGGNPGHGKSAFMGAVARNVADLDRTVAVFSLETVKRSFYNRMVCAEACYSLNDFRQGLPPRDKAEARRLMDAIAIVNALPIFIDDSRTITPMDIAARCRRLKRERGDLALVVIDYLQLVSFTPQKGETRNDAVDRGMRQIANIAWELDCTVLLGSQLTRENAKSPNPRPQVHQLRDSGSIEAYAHGILFTFRMEKHLQAVHGSDYLIEEKHRGKCEIIIAKQKDGGLEDITLPFIAKYAAFGQEGPPQ